MITEENTPSGSIEEAGEKVTGGSEAAGNNSETNDNNSTDNKSGEELTPEKETKKEEIDGYNEHPDQAKVGGG